MEITSAVLAVSSEILTEAPMVMPKFLRTTVLGCLEPQVVSAGTTTTVSIAAGSTTGEPPHPGVLDNNALLCVFTVLLTVFVSKKTTVCIATSLCGSYLPWPINVL